MAYALVGSVGAVTTGSSGASVNPAFAQTPGAGNLLILWVTGGGAATFPAAPAGWTLAKQGGLTTESVSVFYRIAAGGDTAPTVAAVSSVILNAQLAEFTREGGIGSQLDVVVASNGVGGTLSATATTKNRAPAELIVYCAAQHYSAPATATNSVSSVNNGGTANDTNNNASSVADHYVLGYVVNTKTNAAAQGLTVTQGTGNLSNATLIWASFLLADSPGRDSRMPLGA